MNRPNLCVNEAPEQTSARRSLWKGPSAVTLLILIIPLLGNHFVEGWNWSPRGFVVFGTLVFCICFSYQLLTRNRDATAYRAAVGLAVAATFSLLWGNLVQFFDVNPAAIIYFAVPIVGLIGVTFAGSRPNGMARALFATALAQALALGTVLTLRLIRDPEFIFWTPPEWRGFAGNALNVILFVASAILFRKAARHNSAPAVV